MGTMFDDVECECPYFQRSDKRRIVCEGLSDKSKLANEFSTEKARDEFKKENCNHLNNNCLIKRMLDQKWSENDKRR